MPARREEEGLVSNQILSILLTEGLFDSFFIHGIQEFVGEVTFSDDCRQGARRARLKGPLWWWWGGGCAVINHSGGCGTSPSIGGLFVIFRRGRGERGETH